MKNCEECEIVENILLLCHRANNLLMILFSNIKDEESNTKLQEMTKIIRDIKKECGVNTL